MALLFYFKEGFMNKLFNAIKKNRSTILAGISVVGVIATTVLAVENTTKAMEIIEKKTKESEEEITIYEKVLVAAPAYIPTIAMGTATIACILGSVVLNKRQQASLISAYGVVDKTFKDYRRKLIELHGEEADEEILSEICRERCDYHFLDISSSDAKVEWYEPITKQTFMAYERSIMDAEYHINRYYILRGYITLNEYLSFFGLPSVKNGDDEGWDACSGVGWLDFEHDMFTDKNCHVINCLFGPSDIDELFY